MIILQVDWEDGEVMSVVMGQSVVYYGLLDCFGWLVIDLWVLVIDYCNLRCIYCMFVEGMDWLVNCDLFIDDEIICVIGIGIE